MTAALAALWLTACGGGGGGGDAVATAPTPAPASGSGNTSAPPPAQTPAPAPAPTPVAALTFNATTAPTAVYHWVASSKDGKVLAAGQLPGNLLVSRDGGATWAAGTGLPTNGYWISIDISADGTKLAAVSYGGSMYKSVDSGQTWTQIDSTFNTSGLSYESVTISDDGQHIVAVDQVAGTTAGTGLVHYTDNGGTTWAVATVTHTSGTAVGGNFWRAIDSSADGKTVVAADHNGGTYVSTDSGHTFAEKPVTVNGNPVGDGWYRLALSRDGKTVALAGNQQYGLGGGKAAASTGVYVGRTADAGATWTWNQGANTTGGNYGSVTMSADGMIIGASLYAPTVTGGAPGQVLVSTDQGATFHMVATPAGFDNWRGLAINGTGTQLLLADGDFAKQAAGQVYVSTGSITGQ